MGERKRGDTVIAMVARAWVENEEKKRGSIYDGKALRGSERRITAKSYIRNRVGKGERS